mmetsp:Transcript_26644/g.85434  ORF Transcript_26644/g.85434 Transcript_26644/m.85434 type:complete len:330 (-) Transcript_26644:6310-7299(-)
MVHAEPNEPGLHMLLPAAECGGVGARLACHLHGGAVLLGVLLAALVGRRDIIHRHPLAEGELHEGSGDGLGGVEGDGEHVPPGCIPEAADEHVAGRHGDIGDRGRDPIRGVEEHHGLVLVLHVVGRGLVVVRGDMGAVGGILGEAGEVGKDRGELRGHIDAPAGHRPPRGRARGSIDDRLTGSHVGKRLRHVGACPDDVVCHPGLVELHVEGGGGYSDQVHVRKSRDELGARDIPRRDGEVGQLRAGLVAVLELPAFAVAVDVALGQSHAVGLLLRQASNLGGVHPLVGGGSALHHLDVARDIDLLAVPGAFGAVGDEVLHISGFGEGD